ncbi:MAG: MYXO-CTERM domain-containing protein [Verrucomicrobiales bacterium]
MKMMLAEGLLTLISALPATAGLSTFTYITSDGGGSGSVVGDMTGVGAVTLNDDTAGGDYWNGGDTFTYLHEANQISNSFTATVRVVGQTQDAGGRWGKAGIAARTSLDATATNAMTQVAAGIGSQALAPSRGDHSPVPMRLAGRGADAVVGNGGFENPIKVLGADNILVDSVNNVFPEGADVNATWLSLSYDSATNGFTAGSAPDDNGAPGTWSFSDTKTDIPKDGDGWYVGLGYSAHNSMDIGVDTQGQHGVTFDNYSLSVVPEPSSSLLGLLGLGALALRRRR